MVIAFAGACSEDDEKDKTDCASAAQTLEPVLNNLLDAATAYSSDPTAANCTSYLNAVNTYIEEVEVIIRDCGTQQDISQWEAAISQYESVASSLSCN